MKIRINQDVTFNWKLTVEGESVDLHKLELSVEITTPSNKKVEITPRIQFDTLEFNYRPKQVGAYIASVYLNRFKDGETALDVKAFEGVKYSWNQDLSNDNNLVANTVELTGNLNYGPNYQYFQKVFEDFYQKLIELDAKYNRLIELLNIGSVSDFNSDFNNDFSTNLIRGIDFNDDFNEDF